MGASSAEGVQKRYLGRTGIEITPIGLGTWQLAEGKGFDRFVYQGLSPELTNDVVKAALEGGINWFDTAEGYGWGRSERSLSRALRAADVSDEDVVIATKWWPTLRTAESIRKTIAKRRQCLDGYSIDLYQVHNPWSFSSANEEMEAMADLVDLGLIGAVGISNFWAKRMREAHAALDKRGVTLASNQIKVSLLDRSIEKNGVLKAAKELGITIIAWSPLEMGVLTGKFHKDPGLIKSRPMGRRIYMKLQTARSRRLVEGLEEIAAAYGVTPTVVALSWVITFYGETVVAIPGSTKVSHVEQNATAMQLKLSEREIEHLDGLSNQFQRPFGLRLK